MNRVKPKLPCLISLLSVSLILSCSAESPPLESVATSEIIVGGLVSIYEESDELSISVKLSTLVSGDNVGLAVTLGELDTELQTLQADGTYKFTEDAFKYPDLRAPIFSLKDYKAPMSYRVMLFRPNGEEVELLKVDVETKFRSSYSSETLSHANNDPLELGFGFDGFDGFDSSYDFSGRMRVDFSTKCVSKNNYIEIDESVASGTSAFPYKITSQRLTPDGISSEEFPCKTDYYGILLLSPELSTSTIATQVGGSLENAGDSLSVEIWPTPAVITITE